LRLARATGLGPSICALVNGRAKQAALQERIIDDTRALRHMYATANPSATLELTRTEALEQRIDDCFARPGQPAP